MTTLDFGNKSRTNREQNIPKHREMPRNTEPVRLSERQRAQEHCVDCAEDDAVGSDPQCEQQYHEAASQKTWIA